MKFYENDQVLVDAVAAYTGSGLGQGEAGLIIATETHRWSIEEKLRSHGLDLAYLKSRKQLVLLDARETLARFMIDGVPDEGRFMQSVGGQVEAAARGRPGLRAFGEMVSLLWADGNPEAAVALERLWNELYRARGFTLFCAYPISGFRDAAQGGNPRGRGGRPQAHGKRPPHGHGRTRQADRGHAGSAILADRLKDLHPGIRILFMSGYTGNFFLPDKVIDPGAKMLQKPFGQVDLPRILRELLESAQILASIEQLLLIHEASGNWLGGHLIAFLATLRSKTPKYPPGARTGSKYAMCRAGP